MLQQLYDSNYQKREFEIDHELEIETLLSEAVLNLEQAKIT